MVYLGKYGAPTLGCLEGVGDCAGSENAGALTFSASPSSPTAR